MRATTCLAAILLLGHTTSFHAAPTRSHTDRDISSARTPFGVAEPISPISPAEQRQVEAYLLALGCSAGQVKTALTLLSPADVHHLVLNIRELQVAGGSRKRVVVTVAAVVVAVLVILVARTKPHINLGDSY
jgi:hypothetical protein